MEEYLVSIVAAGLLCFACNWLIQKLNYWNKRGIAHFKFRFTWMSFYWLDWEGNIFQFYKRLYTGAAPYRYFGYYFLCKPKLVIRDPDLIKEIFVRHSDKFAKGVTLYSETDPYTQFIFNMSGDQWKQTKMHISPAFSIAKLKQMQSLIVAPAVAMQNLVTQRIQASRNIMNPNAIIIPYIADVSALCLFGVNANTINFPKSMFLRMGARIPGKNRLWKRLNGSLLYVPGKWRHHFLSTVIDEEAAIFFKHLVMNTVRYRRENNVTSTDFLQYFMDLAESNEDNVDSTAGKHKWTLESTVAHNIIFLYNALAEIPTIVNSALYEIAKNPGIRTKLRQEIEHHSKESNGQINFETSEMIYLHQVVQETSRKYPSTTGLSRRCTQTCKISDQLTVEEGTTAIISVSGLHHDPEYYPEPEKFDPERFSKENREFRHPYCYLPFGVGPRACSAEKFVICVVEAAIVSLVSKFEITVLSDNIPPFELDPGKFSTPPRGIKLCFTEK